MRLFFTYYLSLYAEQVCAAGDETCRCIQADYQRKCGEKNIFELETIKKDECVQLDINADSFWNASGLVLDKGASYKISVGSAEYWCDAGIKSSVMGWRTHDETLESCEAGAASAKLSKMQKWIFSKVEGSRRYPDANWFELIGVNAKDGKFDEFRVALQHDFEADMSGEFCAYANDLKYFYWNNSRSLKITIKRTD